MRVIRAPTKEIRQFRDKRSTHFWTTQAKAERIYSLTVLL